MNSINSSNCGGDEKLSGAGEGINRVADRDSGDLACAGNPVGQPSSGRSDSSEGSSSRRIGSGAKIGSSPSDSCPSGSSLSASIAGLSEKIGAILNSKNHTIALAESCTGGLISGALTEVPGSSGYFGYGVVSYSNEAKMEVLKVSEATLAEYGAVSPQTAIEMAEGVRNLAEADYGISVTGIAGPGGGSETKPVGLVYVGFSSAAGSVWCELRLKGSRHEIRQATVKAALSFALDQMTRLGE